MHDEGVDLILMPHAWPTPVKASGLVKESDITAQHDRMTELPRLYAISLGVPVVFANQIGRLQPLGGLLGHLMDPETWRLRGQSRIVDSDGTLAGKLDDHEGVLTATVSTDPSRKHYQPPQDYHGWLQPGSAITRRIIIPLDIAAGRLSYSLSHQRRRQARAALANHATTPATTPVTAISQGPSRTTR
jgi:hypothetical protein